MSTDTPKQKTRRTAGKPIPPGAYGNVQLSLFQNLLCNSEDERADLSNAIDLWDSIPRFAVSRQAMGKMRTAEGFLEVLEMPFHHRGVPLTAMIHPARIKQAHGKSLDFYPSAGEELLEQILRKIAVEQFAGFFDKPDFRSGVRFTLHMLRREMQERGHARSYQEIQESLHIMAYSVIEIHGEDEKEQVFAASPYLPFLAGVTRKTLDEQPDAKWIAQFHPLVTQSIDQLTYRQFNYGRLMSCRTQLARWLICQLVSKYTAASITNKFDMRYSTIKRDSALLSGYTRERDAIAALDAAWDEVKAQQAVMLVTKAAQRGARGKLNDVIYSIHPSFEFAAEQKAANRRYNDSYQKVLSSSGHDSLFDPVDNVKPRGGSR